MMAIQFSLYFVIKRLHSGDSPSLVLPDFREQTLISLSLV